MGELIGKVINKVAVQGQTWNPLMPTSSIRSGNTITISYAIPVRVRLEIDTTRVAARANYGFTFTQTGGNNVSISSVQLVNDNTQVKITLSAIPTGSNQKIRYAWGCGNYTWFCGGAATGLACWRKYERDSDYSISTASGSTNLPLFNWSVAFEEPVTMISPLVTSFFTPVRHNTLTIPIVNFVASEDVGVTGYLITESAKIPSLTNSKWTSTPPTTYTFSSRGSHKIYAWAKDADGNTSALKYRNIIIRK